MTFAAAFNEIRMRAVAEMDAVIARLDALDADTIEKIRGDGARLGIDEARVERDIAALLQKWKPERAWFVRQRAAAALGIVDSSVDPLQV